MKELVVVSGKGGTGKTSIAAALATLAGNVVLADCDVDAPDLHLLFAPKTIFRSDFIGGRKARIEPGRCTACGKCEELCRFDAVLFDGAGSGRVAKTYRVDPLACEGCGVCYDYCTENAIEFTPQVSGQWFVSRCRTGYLVHARLDVGAENSGKLVTELRRAAYRTAREYHLESILTDAAPGIGCPVIASLTGASLALIVGEPTVSGVHDFQRIGRLCLQLGVPAVAVLNKADLNRREADRLQSVAEELDIELLGRIDYDTEVTRAQLAARSVVEISDGSASQAIGRLFQAIQHRLEHAADVQAGGLVQIGDSVRGRTVAQPGGKPP